METNLSILENYGVEDCLFHLSGLGKAISALGLVTEERVSREAVGTLGNAVELYTMRAREAYKEERFGEIHAVDPSDA